MGSFADTRSYSQPPEPVATDAAWGYHGLSHLHHNHHAAAVMSDYQHHLEIPEEYTITVGNLNTDDGSGGPAETSSVLSQARTGAKASSVPPSLMSKPRNITQV